METPKTPKLRPVHVFEEGMAIVFFIALAIFVIGTFLQVAGIGY